MQMQFSGLIMLTMALVGLSTCRGNLGNLDSDIGGGALSVGQVLKGQVAASGSKQRLTTFRYDLAGRPVVMRHVVEGTAYLYTYQYGYVGGPSSGTELGNVQIRMTFPDQEQVIHAFDAMGALQQVTAQMPNGALANHRPSRWFYHEKISGRTKLNRFGQVEWTEAGDHTRTLRTYNDARQPLYVLSQKDASGEILQAFGYSYDKVGRVTYVRDYCAQTPAGMVCCDPHEASCSEGPLSANYEYDVSGWLKKMTSPQGQQEFEVDALGNLVKKNQVLQTYGENGLPHAITSVVTEQGQRIARYKYNNVGSMEEMEEDGVTTRFVWNANNMPLHTQKLGNSTQRSYVGESLYQRVDTVNGKTSTTIFLPGLRIEDGTYRKFYDGAAERESVPSGELAQRRGILHFYHGDHLGSSTLVTDEEGNPVWRAAYFPFGENRFSEGAFLPKPQFTSKEKEEVSGLYDYGARLYNPRTGRFISADSIMDGLNPYSYVRNNPLNLVDPSGHVATDPPTQEPICNNEGCKFVIETKEQAKSLLRRVWSGIKDLLRGGKHGLSSPSPEDFLSAHAVSAFHPEFGQNVYDSHSQYSQWHANVSANESSLFRLGETLTPLAFAYGQIRANEAGSLFATRGRFVVQQGYYTLRYGRMYSRDGSLLRPAVNSNEATVRTIVTNGWTTQTQFYRSMDQQYAPTDGVQQAVPAGQAMALVSDRTQITTVYVQSRNEQLIPIYDRASYVNASDLGQPTLNVTTHAGNVYSWPGRVEAVYSLGDLYRIGGRVYSDVGALSSNAYLWTVPGGSVPARINKIIQ